MSVYKLVVCNKCKELLITGGLKRVTVETVDNNKNEVFCIHEKNNYLSLKEKFINW